MRVTNDNWINGREPRCTFSIGVPAHSGGGAGNFVASLLWCGPLNVRCYGFIEISWKAGIDLEGILSVLKEVFVTSKCFFKIGPNKKNWIDTKDEVSNKSNHHCDSNDRRS